MIPALGLSWSNGVNTRLMLSKTNRVYHPSHHTQANGATEDEIDYNERPKKRSKLVSPKKQKKIESLLYFQT